MYPVKGANKDLLGMNKELELYERNRLVLL